MAQLDFDNWMEVLIALLVVGGSIFGAISKKLIEFFSPQDSDQRRGSDAAPGGRPPHRPRPPQRVPPAHPVARPIAPSPPTVRMPQPPPGRAERATPWPHEARPARRSPPAPAPPPKPPRTRVRARPPVRRQRRIERTGAGLGHLEPTVREHLEHLTSAVEEEGRRIDAEVERHLGHLVPTTAPTTGDKDTTPRRESFLRPTARSLRRIVIMREILAPPLALRPPEDHW